jgi:predicted phosphodiesterase
MRLALISDIHGNALALEAVLTDIGRVGVDAIVCLGDLAAMGPRPLTAIERIASLNCPVVQGNTDDWLIHGLPDPPAGNDTAARIRDVNAWCAAQLQPAHRNFLAGLHPTVSRDIDGVGLLAYHGSPRSHMDNLLPTTPEETLADWFDGADAPVLAGGHTHSQMLRRWQGRTIVNPGSVGLTFQRFPAGARGTLHPWAEYAIVSAGPSGVAVDLRLVSFNREALFAQARSSGMPHVEWWIATWWGV